MMPIIEIPTGTDLLVSNFVEAEWGRMSKVGYQRLSNNLLLTVVTSDSEEASGQWISHVSFPSSTHVL
jgi:hypothetical protein